jgi:hypothetical protein
MEYATGTDLERRHVLAARAPARTPERAVDWGIPESMPEMKRARQILFPPKSEDG